MGILTGWRFGDDAGRCDVAFRDPGRRNFFPLGFQCAMQAQQTRDKQTKRPRDALARSSALWQPCLAIRGCLEMRQVCATGAGGNRSSVRRFFGDGISRGAQHRDAAESGEREEARAALAARALFRIMIRSRWKKRLEARLES